MNEMVTTDDILQQAGVKGMKWGVRKAIKSQIKKANARDRAYLDKYHEKRSAKSPSYVRAYNKQIEKGKSHHSVVRKMRNDRVKQQRVLATQAALIATPLLNRAGKKIAQAAYNTATSPETIRAGKNIILAAKRSKFRVVDGSAMEDVIGAAFSNRLR